MLCSGSVRPKPAGMQAVEWRAPEHACLCLPGFPGPLLMPPDFPACAGHWVRVAAKLLHLASDCPAWKANQNECTLKRVATQQRATMATAQQLNHPKSRPVQAAHLTQSGLPNSLTSDETHLRKVRWLCLQHSDAPEHLCTSETRAEAPSTLNSASASCVWGLIMCLFSYEESGLNLVCRAQPSLHWPQFSLLSTSRKDFH